MHFKTKNVNTAFKKLVTLFNYSKDGLIIKEQSRNGPVLMINEPVTVTYSNPLERVLFNEERDCNPFFHMYEALWMLAGRNDVESLSFYTSKMAQYSDDGKTFNGAYGKRWYKYIVCEDKETKQSIISTQLNGIIDHLKNNPTSRRAVLQMWDIEEDLKRIDTSKDVCCNLCVCFNIRTVKTLNALCPVESPYKFETKSYLDMTVYNRSNDLIKGMLGANYVHFSFLQEYVAQCLGVNVGKYNQVSNNLHVYPDAIWNPIEWLKYNKNPYDSILNKYNIYSKYKEIPLLYNVTKKQFDKELQSIVSMCSKQQITILLNPNEFKSTFLKTVALPMFKTYAYYKENNFQMMEFWLKEINLPDWKLVATQWINKRKEQKQKTV